MRAAADAGCRLVALPEMWPTSFTAGIDEHTLAASERALDAVAQLSGELGLVVCGTAYGRTDGDRPTNRFHVFDGGALVGGYDKLQLFSPTAEHLTFRAGEALPAPVETSVGRLAPVVCYDLRFPLPLRPLRRAGAELCVCCAQWPASRASHLRALVLGRAVEGQWPLLAANRTGTSIVGRRRMELEFPGNSVIVSAGGEVLAEGAGAPGLVLAELDLEAARELRRQVPVLDDERRDL